MADSPPHLWPGDIYKAFKKLGVRQIAYVPDAGHTQLILDCDADSEIDAVSLTSEQKALPCLLAPGSAASVVHSSCNRPAPATASPSSPPAIP